MEDVKTPVQLWEEMVRTFEELSKDVTKNFEKHNVSAGVRVRAGVRSLRKQAAGFLKASIEADREVKEARKAKKAEAAKPAAE